ncbi:MAG: hypothetical protein J0H57_27265, partial [Rhodospirillales bacterium]|nr:hypothetical protein [Rhodospirillales bacterium]
MPRPVGYGGAGAPLGSGLGLSRANAPGAKTVSSGTVGARTVGAGMPSAGMPSAAIREVGQARAARRPSDARQP